MVGRRGAALRVLAMMSGLLLLVPPMLDAHPLHTTLTELTADPAERVVHSVIRVFADDFGKAVAGARVAPPGPVTDAAALAYLQRTFVLADRAGRALPLRACGTRRTAALLWICVEAASPGGVAGLTLRNGILCDLYDDQVNIVRATIAGATGSTLYTRHDRAKPLR